MSTADGAVSSIVPIPGTPDSGVQVGVCAPQDVRPFAASNYRNKVYVGAVCSAESTQDASQLEAYIFEYDPAVDAFAADRSVRPGPPGNSVSPENNQGVPRR